MQRRSSTFDRSTALSADNLTNKHQKMISSAQIFPSQSNSFRNDIQNLSRTNSIPTASLSKRDSDFIQNESSIQLENNQSKKQTFFSRRTILLCTIISLVLILLIILSIVLPLKLATSKTTSSPTQLTTTQNFACISGGLICTTPLFHWNYFCRPTSYNYFSCCYLSPSSTQLTIEFLLQEDISHWSIDDISASQNNGELITNGGFESNLNGWILTVPSNATYVDNQMSLSHTGSSYLYGGSQNTPADLEQTFNVIQGQNINISFWWADGGSSVYIPGKICQATVAIT